MKIKRILIAIAIISCISFLIYAAQGNEKYFSRLLLCTISIGFYGIIIEIEKLKK
jgi:hypothetical protein